MWLILIVARPLFPVLNKFLAIFERLLGSHEHREVKINPLAKPCLNDGGNKFWPPHDTGSIIIIIDVLSSLSVLCTNKKEEAIL